MPKSKKIRSASLTTKQVRHEPLGQTIQDDNMRNKYAAPIRTRRKQKSSNEISAADGEYLDEKTSQKIFEMSKHQQLEIQAEEERDALMKQQQKTKKQGSNYYDDSDEEEEEEIQEIFIDEGEE